MTDWILPLPRCQDCYPEPQTGNEPAMIRTGENKWHCEDCGNDREVFDFGRAEDPK